MQRIWAFSCTRATELVAMVVGVDGIHIDLTNSDSPEVIDLCSGMITHMYASKSTLSHAFTKAENKMFTAKEFGVR